MKSVLSAMLVGALVIGLAAVALAAPPWAGQGFRPGAMMGGGMMGGGWHAGGGPHMGGGWGAGGGAGWNCPGMAGWTAPGQGAGAPAAPTVTEEKARELATEYAQKYFKGYTVERVLPFQGRFYTAYQVELKGPKGEVRILHVNPWGAVRPFGPPVAATE